MSWILPSLIPTNSIWERYTTKNTKSIEQWVGPVESIVALAYKRFRPGAKLKIDSFRISNDHSHAVNVWGDYNFDFQSVKRTFLGGRGADMYNLKNPVFHSFIILNLLPTQKSKLLLELSLQSIDNMMHGIYVEDQVALECLHKISQIISGAMDGEDLEAYQKQLNISQEYVKNPLTKKSMEIWRNHLSWLENICDELQLAYDKNLKGEDYEIHLKNIRIILERVRDEMETFYNSMMQGK